MKLGLIGLGKMGSRMGLKLLQEGHEVVVWNRSPQPVEELKTQSSPLRQGSAGQAKFKIADQKLKVAGTVEELVRSLEKPKIVWLMLPSGEATEEMLDQITQFVEPGDIVIDGSNANYKDTEERYKKFKNLGIRFLGVGVSGGVVAAKTGYPLMVGGDKSAYDEIKPILDSLSKPHGGHQYFGEGGAGAFVKMIHNGIEYGIMQSLAEGFDVLDKAPYSFDMPSVAKLWQKGTLVSGFMLDRSLEVLEQNPQLEGISGEIGISGEADWTVEQAQEENVPVPIIKASLDYRKESHTNQSIANSYTAKFVNALRQAFGGHPVKKEK